MEKIHIHRVCQQQKTTYETLYKKYPGLFDEKGMIDTRELQPDNKSKKLN